MSPATRILVRAHWRCCRRRQSSPRSARSSSALRFFELTPPCDEAAAATRKAALDTKHQRELLLAMAAEWRVLVVKLADRTHNMRTLGAMPAHKREKKAKETLALFVPLARQLGAASVERELYKLSTANIPSFATDDNKLDEWLQDEQIAELQIGSRLARHRQRWEAHCAAAEGRGLCAAE